MTAKKTASTKKSVAKKITPAAVQAVKKSVAKKKAANASTSTKRPAKKAQANVKKETLSTLKPKTGNKPRVNKAEQALKDLVVRLAYTYIPQISEKSVADVKDWKLFVQQLETRMEGHLSNVLPIARKKDK